jgi:hypothetical protein
MSDDAEITMILYSDLLPKEEAILKRMEEAVFRILLANSITLRPLWIGSTKSGERFVQLTIPAQTEPRILLRFPADQLAALSANKLAFLLSESITQG